MRELVHDPMKTVSTATSRIAVPAVEAHVGERPVGRLALGRVGEARRVGDAPVDRDDLGRDSCPT